MAAEKNSKTNKSGPNHAAAKLSDLKDSGSEFFSPTAPTNQAAGANSLAWSDTIVALATPPGIGALGTIRLSGPDSFSIVNTLFAGKDLLLQASHTIHVGLLKEENKIIDEVVLSLFKNPRSYTGEDTIEISGHGSPFIQQQILEACIRQGARLARPGEFTQRAFLNGKIDLTQAEAVADLIGSNTRASQKTALHAMRGGFSEKLKALRERLIRFSALIELELDFSQEDVEFADRKKFYELIHEMQDSTQKLIVSFQLGNVIRNGVSVAIIGKPNAGKSTLLNTLLNEERAIVSEIAGTTRDTIEEVINIEGVQFRLIDTAGIRTHTQDQIEAAGVERSLEKMSQSDLVIYLFDINEHEEELQARKADLDQRGFNYLLVANKTDLVKSELATAKFPSLPKVIFISAKEKSHIDLLKQKMVESVMTGDSAVGDTIVTNARHYQALKEVDHSLSEIKHGLDDQIPGDLLSLDIRRCLLFLGEITGEVSNDEMLDFIFSKFCIGK